MAAHLTVLASGSSGNASLLECGDFGLLIDVGLGPRQLAHRLAHHGANWTRVRAVVLTHTHGDHWNERTLGLLYRQKIPLYCHPAHALALRRWTPAAAQLEAARLLRRYEVGVPWEIAAGLHCRATAIRHDGGPTFALRFDGTGDLFDSPWSLGYAADLGCWDAELAAALTEVDLLALEFNHDVAMQRNSGRSRVLIDRCLGDDGHLSNVQAADLLAKVLEDSTPGRLRRVVQLHLSRECNRPELARSAAAEVLQQSSSKIELHTACQDRPTPRMPIAREASSAATIRPSHRVDAAAGAHR